MSPVQYWDTASQRALTDSAALTIMSSFALDLLSKALDAGSPVISDDLARVVQRKSNIEVRQGDGSWLLELLERVDQRRIAAGRGPLSPIVIAPAAPPVKTRRPAGRGSSAAPKGTAVAAKTSTRVVHAIPLEGNICPQCFMQMSLTGICDNCG